MKARLPAIESLNPEMEGLGIIDMLSFYTGFEAIRRIGLLCNAKYPALIVF
jgi:hypothetical protein